MSFSYGPTVTEPKILHHMYRAVWQYYGPLYQADTNTWIYNDYMNITDKYDCNR